MYSDEKLEQYMKGIKDGQNFIIQAIRESKGIGKTLEKRIIVRAEEIARKKVGL